MGSLNCLHSGNSESNQMMIKKSKAGKRKASNYSQENRAHKSSIDNVLQSTEKHSGNTLPGTNKVNEDSDDDQYQLGVCSPDLVRGDSFVQNYNRLLTGNKEYTKEKTDIDPLYFIHAARDQKPKYLLIGCADSRVPPNEITKTNSGDIFIHRNIANQIVHSDLNCMSVIQYAVEFLGVEHIIVMGHTKCGGVQASKSKAFKGLLDNWIQNIKDVALSNKKELEKCATDEEYFEKLTVFNVEHQVWNVCKTPSVQKAWAQKKKLHVHGWVTDIETGVVHDLKMDNQGWDAMKSYFDYRFK